MLDRRALLLGVQRRAPSCTAPATPTSTRCCRRRRSWPTSRSWWRSRSSCSPTPGMRNLVWPGISLALLGVSAVAIGGIYPLGGADLRGQAERRATRKRRTSSAASTRPGRRSGSATPRRPRTRRTTVTPPATLATDTRCVPNVRLLDPQLVSETFTQLQQVRGFYDFGQKLDIDRYTVERQGRRTTWSASARSTTRADRPAEQLDQQAHRLHPRVRAGGRPGQPGRSAAGSRTSSPASSASRRGSDRRAPRQTEQIQVNQPRIYYGERMATDDYAIVGQSDAEHEGRVRPAGRRAAASEFYTYDGRAAWRSARSSAGCCTPSRTAGVELPALRRGQRELQAALRAQPARPGGEGRAVPHPGRRPVPGGGRRPGACGSSTATPRRPPTRTRSGSTCRPRPPTS